MSLTAQPPAAQPLPVPSLPAAPATRPGGPAAEDPAAEDPPATRGAMSEAEFDAFYRGSHRRLVGQLFAMTGDLGEAQDVVQEAFIRAWDRRSQLRAAEHPEAWVRTVAWRLAVSRWRRSRSTLSAWRRSGAPPDAPAPEVHNVALVAALRRIPEAQRRVVVLHHLCDLSVEAVARETGAPVGTVKAQLSRGRAALRAQLGETVA